MVAFGVRRYGVVDQVPGVLHVASKFFHFNFFPLLPVGSVVVVEAKVFGAETETSTGFSLKSVFFGWLRAALMVAAIAFFFVAFDQKGPARRNPRPGPNDKRDQMVGCWIIAGACLLTWWGSHWLSRAGARRARDLARLVGVPEDLALARFAAAPPEFDEPALANASAAAPEPADDGQWRNPVHRDRHKDDVFRLE